MRFVLLFLLIPVLAFCDDLPQKRVRVHNRVVAHVNGKTISVIDLMKKMDMILFQNYPQYLEVPEARFQFYMSQWRSVLSEWIDRELVLADAAEKKFEVSSGDVREELEEIFGPDMMINLDSTGLTLDEAFSMLKDEITIRRMLFMQVRQRVYPQVTPAEVRKAYAEYVNQLSNQKECTWSAISVKSSDMKEAALFAETIYSLLTNEKIPQDALQDELAKRGLSKESIQVTVSQPFRQKSTELTGAQQELFFSMKKGEYCLPQLQKSRSGDVVRIYYIHDIVSSEIPPLEAVQTTLREEIAERLTQQKTEDYYKELRRHFHVVKEDIENELPENFQPFELR